MADSDDDDVPTLSAATLAALAQFRNEEAALQQQFEALKVFCPFVNCRFFPSFLSIPSADVGGGTIRAGHVGDQGGLAAEPILVRRRDGCVLGQ